MNVRVVSPLHATDTFDIWLEQGNVKCPEFICIGSGQTPQEALFAAQQEVTRISRYLSELIWQRHFVQQ